MLALHEVDKDPPATALPLGAAIAAAIGGVITQTALAEIVGVTQPTISRWVNGSILPTLDDLTAIEQASGRPRGWILHAAGYIEDVLTVPEAIDMDAALTDSARRAMHGAYLAAIQASEAERSRRRR